MNIILCGMPGSGKTQVGQGVAKALGCPFIDTDRLIEKEYALQTGRALSCREIFIGEGELFFRSLEKEAISSLSRVTGSVIAVGGGSVCDADNVKILRSLGLVVYLQASAEVLWRRLCSSPLPAYLDTQDPQKAFDALLNQRLPLYRAAAHCIVDVDGLTQQTLVRAILNEREKIYGQ